MKAKTWLISFLIIITSALCIIGYIVYYVDPFFHYHRPREDEFYYEMDNERSMNDGIVKHFDYDAIITGTSMTENFRTSEMDELFNCNSIKVSCSGGSYKEINDNLLVALNNNPDVKVVIRSIDKFQFLTSWDYMRYEAKQYPSYLYDNNLFNDVDYIYNKEIIFGRVYPMIEQQESGITTFDQYSRWQDNCEGRFGYKEFYSENLIDSEYITDNLQKHLSDEDKQMIKKNIEMNITSIADEYPNIEFYYFYPPYSISSWNQDFEEGELYRYLEAEEYFTEQILPHKNIHLFSFNNRTDITTNLNNYKDNNHYGCWVNSLMLKWMSEGKYQLTESNYKEYYEEEYEFYTNFDYSTLLKEDYPQKYEDYEADFYAGALLNHELTGADPLNIINDGDIEMSSDGNIKFDVDMSKGYNYLCFYCQKENAETEDIGPMIVNIYDKNGNIVGGMKVETVDLDCEKHQYALDLTSIDGIITVEMQGGISDCSKNGLNYLFSDIYIY